MVNFLKKLVPQKFRRKADPRKETEYAQLSHMAYLGEDCFECNKFRKALRKRGLSQNYKVLPEFSTKDHVAFKNAETNNAVLAFRGTNPTNTRDLRADLAIATGLQAFAPRFADAGKVTREMIERFGKENVHVTGHSLGGSQALHAAGRHGVEAHAYNPGAGLPKSLFGGMGVMAFLAEKIGSKAKPHKTHIYTTGVDPISRMSVHHPNASVHFRKPKQLDVHGLSNFLPSNK
jgi:Protein of unknown function (DUF2974).